MGATALGSSVQAQPFLPVHLLLSFRGIEALVLVVLLAWGWLEALGELGGEVQRGLRGGCRVWLFSLGEPATQSHQHSA